MTETLAFLVGLMTFWVEPIDHTDITRYREIAVDALLVAQERDWTGLTPSENAVVILSIASFESGYRADIDAGVVRGDGGKAVCLGQVHAPGPQRELAAKDRKACFRLMLTKVSQTWEWCYKLPWMDRLSGYTVGKCVRSATSRKYSKRILEGLDGLEEAIPIDKLDDPDKDVEVWSKN